MFCAKFSAICNSTIIKYFYYGGEDLLPVLHRPTSLACLVVCLSSVLDHVSLSRTLFSPHVPEIYKKIVEIMQLENHATLHIFFFYFKF